MSSPLLKTLDEIGGDWDEFGLLDDNKDSGPVCFGISRLIGPSS